MPDQLLPPDPSKDGWYWVKQAYATKAILWDSGLRSWQTDREIIQGWDAHRRGWTLASPHPIPGPEELDEIVRVAVKTNQNLHEMAQNLRAALGAKPDDPPGNGLDDVRAAAMDQWGIPRAGEGTAP